MTPLKAEKIVKQYGGAFVNSGQYIARKKSLLPCSKAKIKLAYFVYLDELIHSDLLTEKLRGNLAALYGSMNSFINDDEVDRINKTNEKMKMVGRENMDPESIKEYNNLIVRMVDVAAIDEINTYIAECKKERL